MGVGVVMGSGFTTVKIFLGLHQEEKYGGETSFLDKIALYSVVNDRPVVS